MDWLEITVQTTAENIESVAAMLTAGGFADLVIEDQQAFSSFLEENRAYWDYIDEKLQQQLQGLSRIKLYLEAGDESGFARLQTLLERSGLAMEAKPMAEENWEESWKENYPPQQIGSRLTVVPYWLADSVNDGRLPVILDPGLTFGTGAHPSTQMVMEAMEERVRPGTVCLDLGSGSGILSIAALRLGAKKAIGMEIDPKAEEIARENAAYNGFSAPAFTALTGNVTEDKALMRRLAEGEYDVLLVNIVADVIIGLSPILPDFMGPRTVLICSGILDSRLADVTDALEAAGLTVTAIRAKEEWRCVTAKKGGSL